MLSIQFYTDSFVDLDSRINPFPIEELPAAQPSRFSGPETAHADAKAIGPTAIQGGAPGELL